MQSINVQYSVMVFFNSCAQASHVSATDVLRVSEHIPNWQPLGKPKL